MHMHKRVRFDRSPIEPPSNAFADWCARVRIIKRLIHLDFRELCLHSMYGRTYAHVHVGHRTFTTSSAKGMTLPANAATPLTIFSAVDSSITKKPWDCSAQAHVLTNDLSVQTKCNPPRGRAQRNIPAVPWQQFGKTDRLHRN